VATTNREQPGARIPGAVVSRAANFFSMNKVESESWPLIVVVGPTASGKSTLAVALAKVLQAEIIACDSTQLYRGVNIGTAKPTLEERQGVVHHLVDVLDASEAATAGGYRHLALAVLGELRTRGKLPILAVGTGLYMRALLEGLAELPLRSEELRERLRASSRKHGEMHLNGVLRRMDADAARRIAPTDEQKLIRAIEVCILTRKPISEVHRAGRSPLQGWRTLQVGLLPSREMLYERIDARTEAMIESGWLAEVRGLLAAGIAQNAKIFDFIGYREMLGVLSGDLTMEKARTVIQLATRHYAKRQMTWFRKDKSIRWFAGPGDNAGIQREIFEWVSNEMGVSSRRG
jgi:tRNA dimethylallyltransferase